MLPIVLRFASVDEERGAGDARVPRASGGAADRIRRKVVRCSAARAGLPSSGAAARDPGPESARTTAQLAAAHR